MEKEWNIDVAWRRIIYISVVNFFLIFNFYFVVFGLRYTHPVSFSTPERVGLGFFFLFFFEILFRILKFSMDARASGR